jgi:hypothetical protein
MFFFFLVFYKINRVKLDFLHYGSQILDHILKIFSSEHSLGKVLTFLGATSKLKKLPTLLMTLLLLGNTACKSPKLENPCDPKTESNKNTILIKHFIGDTSANNWVAVSAPGATNQWQSVVFGNGQWCFCCYGCNWNEPSHEKQRIVAKMLNEFLRSSVAFLH